MLSLNIHPDLGSHDCKAAWNVMVQSRKFEWLVKGSTTASLFTFSLPPCVLVGVVDADCFMDALMRQKAHRPLQRFADMMRRKASYSSALSFCLWSVCDRSVIGPVIGL